MKKRHIVLLAVILLAATATAARALSLAVSGTVLEDGASPIFLRGVNVGGPAYSCMNSTPIISDTPLTQATLDAMKTWHINAVRTSINEACWLGINGEPNTGMTAATYRADIIAWTNLIESNGMYPSIVDQWPAIDGYQPAGQQPAPGDHAIAFWQSVAAAYSGDHAIIFDLFNEPHGAWPIWQNGGAAKCQPRLISSSNPCPQGTGYTSPGMNAIISAIRGTEGGGWKHVLDVENNNGSLEFAKWKIFRPTDSASNLVADIHNYQVSNSDCMTTSCYNSTYQPIASIVPVIMTEVGNIPGQNSCNWNSTGTTNPLLDWFRAHASGFYAWSWLERGASDPTCAGPTLLAPDPNGYKGMANPYGQGFENYLSTYYGR